MGTRLLQKVKKYRFFILVLTTFLGGALLYSLSLSTPGIDSRLLTDDGVLSDGGKSKIEAVLKSANSDDLIRVLDESPELIAFLIDEIQNNNLGKKWSDEGLNRFSDSVSISRGLLVSYKNGIEHKQFSSFDLNRDGLSNYLSAFVSLKKKQGEGVVSAYNLANQSAVSEANKLLIEIQQGQDLNQQIAHLADWYVVEKRTKPKLTLFEVSLLHSAWLLSAKKMKLNAELAAFDLEKGLKKDADLIRLLSNENKYVAMNAAALIAYFAPENAITALRFQLVRSSNKQFSFLLLDAVKSYGKHRELIEPQLNKMLQVTSDSDLQEKIMETIDHLHGRSNKLLSKSR
jgi:hypothetical protein